MHFVNALALSGLETLKHLQKVFVNFTVVNALARAPPRWWSLETGVTMSAPGNWGQHGGLSG